MKYISAEINFQLTESKKKLKGFVKCAEFVMAPPQAWFAGSTGPVRQRERERHSVTKKKVTSDIAARPDPFLLRTCRLLKPRRRENIFHRHARVFEI
jgi:hypothetical protein